MVSTGVTDAAESRITFCERQWDDLSSKHAKTSAADYEGLLNSWKSLDKECGSLPTYKARMALVYFYLDRLKEAHSELVTLSPENRQNLLVRVVEILVDLSLLNERKGGQLNTTELTQFDTRIRSVLKDKPTDPGALTLLADVSSELGKHELAIELYEKALEAVAPSPRGWGILRNLTIAYGAANRYEEAYDMAGKSLALNRALMSDPYFMCTVAKAQAYIGKLEAAKETIEVLAAKRPDVKTIPEFKEAVIFVRQKLNEAGR